MLTGDNGVLSNATAAKIQTELANYKEELGLFIIQKTMENADFDEKSLTVGRDSINYNTMKDGETGNIKTIMPDLKDEYLSNVQIIKGNLSIKTQDKKIIKIAQNIGIDVNPYDITEDGELVSSTGNLLLMGNDGSLVLPDGVKKIGYGAFSGVSGLKKIVIPASVTEIEAYAFANNSTLESVEIKGNLEKIGDYAFDGDTNLINVNLPDSINYIGMRAFRTTGLTEITVPKKLENIEIEVFDSCPIKKLILQEGIKRISDGVFANGEFESIELPSTLNSISSLAFSNCKKLINIDVSKNNNFTYESGILMNKNSLTITFISSAKLESISELEIPEGIKDFSVSIWKYTNINKLILPSTMETLAVENLPNSINEVEVKAGNKKLISENNILYNTDNKLIMCYSKEKEITIQEGIKSIGTSAFYQANNVQNINLPDSLNKIGRRIVTNSAQIKNINIGENVNEIDPLFKNMNYNGNVNISSKNSKYEVIGNVLYEKNEGKKEILVRILHYIDKTVSINSEVKKIGDYAFYGQWGLTEITIPEGVKVIEKSFQYCVNLLKVEIPSTVTSISSGCFSDVTNNLSQIIIKNKENSIPGAPWGAVKGMKVVTWNP